MASLALAHLLHRKLRTTLSILAVGIGIAMLIVMLGLSHGMLNEVATRMSSVEADLIVLPENENVIFTAGAAFSGKVGPAIEAFEYRGPVGPNTPPGPPLAGGEPKGRRVVRRAIGVMVDTLQMGGQQQRLFGVDRRDMSAFLGPRKMIEGRLFDENRQFGDMLDARRNAEGYYDPSAISDEVANGACELVIDDRLARVGKYHVGDHITFLGRPFEIVGIVESGVAGRVFCPIQVLQNIKNGGVPWVSFFFVQLIVPDGAGKGFETNVADALSAAIAAKVEPKAAYRDMLYDSFSQVYVYINVASGVALTVCFLFIMLTMYTMVLERTREIGILKALGAGRWYLLREAIHEAVLVCVCGTVVGIGFAYGAKAGLEHAKPLLTLDIQPQFVGLALVIGIIGGTVSALYPGYRAARLDPVAALSFD